MQANIQNRTRKNIIIQYSVIFPTIINNIMSSVLDGVISGATTGVLQSFMASLATIPEGNKYKYALEHSEMKYYNYYLYNAAIDVVFHEIDAIET